MTLFADTSLLFAGLDETDTHHARASELFRSSSRFVTSEYVVLETWMLTAGRIGWTVAEGFWSGIRASGAAVERIAGSDLDRAAEIGRRFADQRFSLVDRTSFAAMERLGITRVATFDDNLAIYRYGPRGERAFEIVR